MDKRFAVGKKMSRNIYRYVVRYDAGTAPNPHHGWCTLAICKPQIRKQAQPGDWVMGFRSRNLGGIKCDIGHVLYAMQVEESLSFFEYWNDPRFRNRRPSRNNPWPDNIYKPVIDAYGNDSLEWVKNHVHCKEARAKDTGGRKVLVANKYWYFGKRSSDSRYRLPHDLLRLAATTQGHVVHKGREKNDLSALEHWLAQFPQGMLGAPSMDMDFVPGTSCSRCA